MNWSSWILLNTEVILGIFISRLLSSETLAESARNLVQYAIRRRDLIDLPEDYTALLKKGAEAKSVHY